MVVSPLPPAPAPNRSLLPAVPRGCPIRAALSPLSVAGSAAGSLRANFPPAHGAGTAPGSGRRERAAGAPVPAGCSFSLPAPLPLIGGGLSLQNGVPTGHFHKGRSGEAGAARPLAVPPVPCPVRGCSALPSPPPGCAVLARCEPPVAASRVPLSGFKQNLAPV